MKIDPAKFKMGKSQIITLAFFILGGLFLIGVILLYTPWFKNSHYYKLYQAKKTLNSIPYSSPMRKAFEHYVDCLKNNQTTCQYSQGGVGGPTPTLGQ